MTRIIYPSTETIAYLEADVNYTIFHLNNGKKIIVSFTLKKYATDDQFNGFLRVHKSFLLNPDYVSNYEQKGKKARVHLSNGQTLEVARRKINSIKNYINQR
jgi:two-component system LytT family response regulator